MKNASIVLPGAAIDNGSEMLAKTPAFLVLQSQVGGNWQHVLNNFQSIAPTDVEKEIYLVVCESSLPPNTYLQFVDRLTKLVEDGRVDKQFLLWALLPGEKNSRGIFDDKYNSATALDIIKITNIIYSGDSNITRFCDAMLNKYNRDKINFSICISVIIVGAIGSGYLIFHKKNKS